ncbi:MAG: hypothetical protein JSV04_05300 [Candidatus Heimdallarchaeota archaeon]|nr:MAG: hypothetical protein JSV04_05300 [Candidatus Heimdallarchaeota archaeon]
MEALKHSEWTFGLIFFWFAFVNVQLTASWIVIILISSQLPDILSLTLRRLGLSNQLVRKVTHDFGVVILLWLCFPFQIYPEINLITVGLAAHYAVDLFSGLEPIYIGGFLFGERSAALYVTADHRIAIGKRIENWGSDYLVTKTEQPTPELAWFWVMQLSGTIFCSLGVIAYLL